MSDHTVVKVEKNTDGKYPSFSVTLVVAEINGPVLFESKLRLRDFWIRDDWQTPYNQASTFAEHLSHMIDASVVDVTQ
jgi:hypothetical protein